MDEIQFETFKGEPGVAIRINGRLDGNTAPALERHFNDNIQEAGKPVILDLEHVGFISSAGLRALLGLAKRLHKEKSVITVVNVQSTVQEVLEISGFDSLFNHKKTLPDALKGLGFPSNFCAKES